MGNGIDPRQVRDITLTAYRDAIDCLDYFRDGYGSMVDGVGTDCVLANRVLEDRVGKTERIICAPIC